MKRMIPEEVPFRAVINGKLYPEIVCFNVLIQVIAFGVFLWVVS